MKRQNQMGLINHVACRMAFGSWAAFFFLAGCGDGAAPDHLPDLTPLTIIVTHNGTPVEGASVLLAPEQSDFSAAGLTDAEGKAVMKTDGTYEGVVPGSYFASVTKLEKLELDIGETPSDPAKYAEYEKKLAEQPMPKHLLPEKYSSFGSSGLKVTAGSEPEITLDLKD